MLGLIRKEMRIKYWGVFHPFEISYFQNEHSAVEISGLLCSEEALRGEDLIT